MGRAAVKTGNDADRKHEKVGLTFAHSVARRRSPNISGLKYGTQKMLNKYLSEYLQTKDNSAERSRRK